MAPRATSLPKSKPKPKKGEPNFEEITKLLADLGPEQLAAIRVKLFPKRESPIPRDDVGGLSGTIPFTEILEEQNRLRSESWNPRAGRYYFSKSGRCFRYAYWADKGKHCDCGNGETPDQCKTHRFAPGRSQSGIGTERAFQTLLEETYASNADGSLREGIILKDIRMTEPIEVVCEDGSVDVIFMVGKSDQMVIGDNLRILNFYEVKSPFYWPKDKTAIANAYGTVVPLSEAGIEEPDNGQGIVNINQALQLAAGAHILRENGIVIEQVTLFYVDRSNYDNHLEILLTPQQCEILHDWAVWWATEHHLNLKSDEPPAAQFCMGWECGRCPFAKACADLLKAKGEKRVMHPAVIGINERLVQASIEEPQSDSSNTPG